MSCSVTRANSQHDTRIVLLYFVVSRRRQPVRHPHSVLFSFQNTDPVSILLSSPNLTHSLLSLLSGRVPTTDSIPYARPFSFLMQRAASPFSSRDALFLLLLSDVTPMNRPLQGRGLLAVPLEAWLFACLDVHLDCCCFKERFLFIVVLKYKNFGKGHWGCYS